VDAARRLGSSQFRRNSNSKHPGKRNRSTGHRAAVRQRFQGNLIKPSLMNLNTRVPSEARRRYVGHGCIIIPLLKLDNRDRIILLASDINVKSKIVPNCFDNPEDVEIITSIRTIISVGQRRCEHSLRDCRAIFTPNLEIMNTIPCIYWKSVVRRRSFITSPIFARRNRRR